MHGRRPPFGWSSTAGARYGRLDSVFANAGINGVQAPSDDLEPHEWRRTLDVNLTRTFLSLRAAVPWLKRQGGSVVICSSINGTRRFSLTGTTAYACSKEGQVALAKMLAFKLARHRIRVNVVCPGAVETPIHERTVRRHAEGLRIPVEYPAGGRPLTGGPMATPDQVARVVAFLASDAADYVTGAEVVIDGTESLLMG